MARMVRLLDLLVMSLTVACVCGLSRATVHFTNHDNQEEKADVLFPDSTEVGLEQVGSLCFERISDIPVIHLESHPGIPNLAVIATRAGKLSLISLPVAGTAQPAKELGTWLDISSRVDGTNAEGGFLSFAFHPNFNQNGRFFVSYTCDARKVPDCQGPCACNPASDCQLGGYHGASCHSNTIVAEYRAAPPHRFSSDQPADFSIINHANVQDYSASMHVGPREVNRYVNIGRPFPEHNGGHVFFGTDGFLYYASGDGGNDGDPFDFAQRGNNLLGKILRVDVDGSPAEGRNYGIPPSNPFVGVAGVYPEIYALGLRNPWRCDQDAATGTIVCGDVGQSHAEEINIILPGHNYLWRNYEGNFSFSPSSTPPVASMPESDMVGSKAWPVFQYLHMCSPDNSDGPAAAAECVESDYVAVIGGVVYRSALRNKCLQGSYVYNDISGPMWVADILPSEGSNPSSRRVMPVCAESSPLQCLGGGLPVLGGIWAWGKDSNGDAYALGNMGIFRLVDLQMCGATC